MSKKQVQTSSRPKRQVIREISFVGKTEDEINEIFRSIGNPDAIPAFLAMCMPKRSQDEPKTVGDPDHGNG